MSKALQIIALLEGDFDEASLLYLCSWLSGSYSEEDAKAVTAHKWDKRFLKSPSVLYRGEPFRENDKKQLESGKLKTSGVSWTTDKKIAEQFAKDHDSDEGIIITYKPKQSDIGLNVEELLKDKKVTEFLKKEKCKFYQEYEVILTNIIPIKKSMIEIIKV